MQHLMPHPHQNSEKNCVANFDRSRVPFGNFEPQDVVIRRDRGDTLACHDDTAFGDGNAQNASLCGCQHFSLIDLRFDDPAFGFCRFQIICCNIEGCLSLIDAGLYER